MKRTWFRTVGLAAVLASALVATMAGPAADAAPQAKSASAASRPAPIEPTGHANHKRAATALPRHNTPNPLLKELFSLGNDNGVTDGPTLSALCQSYLGKPNPYQPIAPNVDVISGDGVVPVGSQKGCSTVQNETTVAVNPYNPRNIVAGSNDYRLFNSRENRVDAEGFAYTSFDGGATWANVQLPHLDFKTGASAPLSYMDAAGDPSVAFGPNNTVYYATLVFSRSFLTPTDQGASGIAVSVSHDGGLTWGEPAILHLDGLNPDGTPFATNIFNDKEWVAADPFSGKVYVTWTQFTNDAAGNFVESPVVESGSTDFGKTWSGLHRISPSTTGFTGGITSFGSGTNPVVANDGTLYVAYESPVCVTLACNALTDHDAVIMATSHDGGVTYSNKEVSLDFDFPVNADVNNNALTGENFRINSFPQLAYDRLTNHMWITWADDRHGQYSNRQSVKTNGDVFLTDAAAESQHWSTPVSIGTAADEVFPAVAVLANKVAVSFYTRGYDPNGIGLDFAYVAGNGNQLASAPIQRLTGQSENPQVQFVGVGAVTGNVLQGVFIGDYTAIAMGWDFRIHPVWTDFRGNPGTTTPNQDVFTQSIPLFPNEEATPATSVSHAR
jgi:hypothetical protein